ncbi:MAG: RNase adapter RapZ [Duodenibacillus sp.]|nr:RNase adapter RapZ [Duodenibacillus sp.]
MPDPFRLIVVTGLSGSGKSIAIRQLEDLGFYCIDNLPLQFLSSAVDHLRERGFSRAAVSVDSRSGSEFSKAGRAVEALAAGGIDARVISLVTSMPELVTRFSETRRRHPLTVEQPGLTLPEALEIERERLAPLMRLGAVLDTTRLLPNALRDWVRQIAGAPRSTMTLAFESFAFKRGLPVAADLVFDVRNLPNPYYEEPLRGLTGLDAPVARFLEASPDVQEMLGDIERFIRRWLPSYQAQNRHYLTVAVGCTGGQHRSVFMAEALGRRLGDAGHTVTRHRELSRKRAQ